MSTTWGASTWSAYVRLLRDALGMSQIDFAEQAFGAKGQQGKVSRWESGKSAPPDRAADVAAFARALNRNPLEAFVAAGMLEPAEAGRGLSLDDRKALAGVLEMSWPRRKRGLAEMQLALLDPALDGPPSIEMVSQVDRDTPIPSELLGRAPRTERRSARRE